MNRTLKNAIYTGLVGLVLLGSTANAREAKPEYPVPELSNPLPSIPLPVIDVPVAPKKVKSSPIKTPLNLDETLKDNDGCTNSRTSDNKTVTVCPDGDFGQRTIEYDAQGRKVRETLDVDGTVTVHRVIEYDAQGRKVKESEDPDNNGTADRVDTFEYDNNGLLRKEKVGDRISEYDAQGVLRKEIVIESRPRYDGTYEHIYEYDAQGRKVKEIRDIDQDGKLDCTTDFQYASGNRLIRETFECGGGIERTIEHNSAGSRDMSGNNGRVGRIKIFLRNPMERLSIEETFDRNAAGKLDQTVKYTESIQTQVEDRDGDGRIDEIKRIGYGSQGSVLNGKPFYWNTTDEIGSPRGIIITETLDKDGDGRTDEIRIVEYSNSGYKVSETLDKDGDGRVDRMVYFETYDPIMQTSSDYIDENGDGIVDRTIEYEHLDWGKRVKTNDTIPKGEEK